MDHSKNTIDANCNMLKLSRGAVGQLTVVQHTFLGPMQTVREVNDSGARITFTHVPGTLKVAGHNPQKLQINFSYTSPGEKNFGSIMILSLSELFELTNFLNGIVQKEISDFVDDSENIT